MWSQMHHICIDVLTTPTVTELTVHVHVVCE